MRRLSTLSLKNFRLATRFDKVGRRPSFRFSIGAPLGFEAGDTNLYRYVGNNSTNETDPTGLVKLSYDVVQKLTATGKYGAASYKSRWELDQPTQNGGVIIQRVEYTWLIKDANGKEVTINRIMLQSVLQKDFNSDFYPYQEAWTVAPGQKETTLVQEQRKKGVKDPWDDSITSPSALNDGYTAKTEGL